MRGCGFRLGCETGVRTVGRSARCQAVPHAVRVGRQAATTRHPGHAQPTGADERHGLRRDDPAAGGDRLTKKLAWAGLESSSFHTHMDQEMNAQLFVRMTTQNFEESIRARREGRPPTFTDGL